MLISSCCRKSNMHPFRFLRSEPDVELLAMFLIREVGTLPGPGCEARLGDWPTCARGGRSISSARLLRGHNLFVFGKGCCALEFGMAD